MVEVGGRRVVGRGVVLRRVVGRLVVLRRVGRGEGLGEGLGEGRRGVGRGRTTQACGLSPNWSCPQRLLSVRRQSRGGKSQGLVTNQPRGVSSLLFLGWLWQFWFLSWQLLASTLHSLPLRDWTQISRAGGVRLQTTGRAGQGSQQRRRWAAPTPLTVRHSMSRVWRTLAGERLRLARPSSQIELKRWQWPLGVRPQTLGLEREQSAWTGRQRGRGRTWPLMGPEGRGRGLVAGGPVVAWTEAHSRAMPESTLLQSSESPGDRGYLTEDEGQLMALHFGLGASGASDAIPAEILSIYTALRAVATIPGKHGPDNLGQHACPVLLFHNPFYFGFHSHFESINSGSSDRCSATGSEPIGERCGPHVLELVSESRSYITPQSSSDSRF